VVTGLQPLKRKPLCEERRIVRRVAARWNDRLECSPRRRSRPLPTGRTKEAAGRAAYRAVMLRCMALIVAGQAGFASAARTRSNSAGARAPRCSASFSSRLAVAP